MIKQSENIGSAQQVRDCDRQLVNKSANGDISVSRVDKDSVAIEEPLLVRYASDANPDKVINLATILRTPGNDKQLVAGFLFNEGHIRKLSQLRLIQYCEEDQAMLVIAEPQVTNVRNYLTHSGCGSCAMEVLDGLYDHLVSLPQVSHNHKRVLQLVGQQLSGNKEDQPLFAKTGGTHAALIYSETGKLIGSAEDVGRHNAMDKVIGKLWLNDKLQKATMAWVSGRMGFELVQKCVSAQIGILVSVGAPTTLALEFAHKYRMHVYAFSSEGRLNYYP